MMSSGTNPVSPPIVGLTGGIGAGKSAVAKMLKEAGCVVADADATVGHLLQSPGIIDTLVRWWGASVLDESGGLDRAAIASIVFADKAERARLEQLLHPLVNQHRMDLFAEAPASTPALVIDAPLLFEVGLDDACDVIVFVDSDSTHCRHRIIASRGWSEAEFERRMQAQISTEEKRARADIVVSNNGDLDALQIEVNRFMQQLTGISDQC